MSIRFFLPFLGAVLILATKAVTAEEPAFKSIFNGKDLSGWKVPDNNIWYSAEEGVLKIKSGPKKKGSTLWTEKEYEDFVMEFEFKFGEGTVDSGIHIKNSDQIQIGISGSLKIDMTALAYIPGKSYPVRKEDKVKKVLKQDDWNHMKIRVKGKTYETWLNGTKIMTYTSESAIDKGPLGIQLHGNRDMAIDYRNLKVAELKS